MDKILINLINAFIGGAGEFLNDILIGLTDKIFYAEKAFTQSLASQAPMNFDSVFNLIFELAMSLIILKFLKKGFDTYVGWYEGDKDSDPSTLLMNFARAIITAVSFKYLYEILVKVVNSILNDILLTLIGVEVSTDIITSLLNLTSNGIFWAVSALVLLICYCILWIKFHVLGIEMFIFRLGFYVACVGLVDSDKGVFAPYIKKLFIMCLTAIVQIFLLRLSLILLGSAHLIWGTAFCLACLKTPKTLQEFMFAYGGGGMSRAVSSAYHVRSLVSSLSRAKGV